MESFMAEKQQAAADNSWFRSKLWTARVTSCSRQLLQCRARSFVDGANCFLASGWPWKFCRPCGTATSRRPRPPGAGGIQVLGTGIRPSRWPRLRLHALTAKSNVFAIRKDGHSVALPRLAAPLASSSSSNRWLTYLRILQRRFPAAKSFREQLKNLSFWSINRVVDVPVDLPQVHAVERQSRYRSL